MWRRAYYQFKPLIPRRLQILMRRLMVQRRLRKAAAVWPIDAQAGEAPDGWREWPGGKRFALVLTHDVETRVGHERCRNLASLEQQLGFTSSFGFVPLRYEVSPDLRRSLTDQGFEVNVHGLYHDGKYYNSRAIFRERAERINAYLKDWGATGFRSPAMHRNLEWILDLNIEYDASSFDTDPFEPQSDGVGRIFPFQVTRADHQKGYVELPYTLPQDFTLFVLMRERDIGIWRRKLDWIVERGGMALMITHPDYMNMNERECALDEYPAALYREFLRHVKERYGGQYWNPLPKEMARFWREQRLP